MSKLEFTNQHYVPKTYTNPWKLDGSFKIIDKEKENHSGEPWNPRSRFYFEEYYTLGYDTPFCLKDDEITHIFGFLDNYIIEMDGNKLTDHKHYASSFKYFNDWIIKDTKTQNPICKDERTEIESRIKSGNNRILDIEFGWHIYENSWHGLRNEIIEVLGNPEARLSAETYLKLKRFIGTQKWRGEDAHRQVKEITDSIMRLIEYPNDKIKQDEMKDMAKQQFLNLLRKFIDGDINSVIQKEIDMYDNLTLVIYKTPTNVKLYTSDNPVLIIQDEDIYNGLYFPILPELLIGLFKGDSTKYHKETLTESMVKKLNNKIIEKAIQYYLGK